MTDAGPPRKKSVALSGVVAGNTALCTVGRTGNDLHYRGYDILEIAETCEFEEIAHLLVHERLPTAAELAAYRAKLKSLRGLPHEVRKVLEALPKSAHPMDVLRTGVSTLGCVELERNQTPDHARDLADRLIASLGSMLLYWHHYSREGVRIEVESDAGSVAEHFLTLLHRRAPQESWVRAMHTSLVLYAEHEFNASTFTTRVIAGTGSDLYSCITGGIGALRGPKHGGANEVALEIQQRYRTPEEAVADIRARVARKEVVIGFGHPVYTVADPRNRVIKDVARRLSNEAGDPTLFRIADAITEVTTVVSQRNPVTGAVSLMPQTTIAGVQQPAIEVLPFTSIGALASNGAAWRLVLLVFIQMIFVTMVYGPIAAYLVEAFPARIRYTALSLPYHIGNGVFGGLLPVIGLSIVAETGNIYAGLYYPIVIALITFVVGSLMLKETHSTLIWDEIQ